MCRILALSLFLLLANTATIFGQTASVNDTVSSFYIGVNSLKLVRNFRSRALNAVSESQHRVFAVELKAYKETGREFRPAVRLGYQKFDVTAKLKDINSTGMYGKAGVEWVFDRRPLKNHALGLHGLISHVWEDNSILVGNDYFGYTRKTYAYRAWLPALEVSYAYTAQLLPRLSIQLEAFVSYYKRSDQNRQLAQLPGIARLVDGGVHFFYKLY